MRLHIVLAFVFGIFLVFGCTDKRNIKNYYFPVEALRKGQVYEYTVKQNDIEAPEYWYYRALRRDSGLYMSSTMYDQAFNIGIITREKIVESGALAKGYLLYEHDSTNTVEGGQIKTEAIIESANIFPFEVGDSTGVFLFSVKYHPPNEPNTTIYIIRNRRYLGDAPDFEFRGKKIKCIRIGVKEVIGNEAGSTEIEGIGEEWYAMGLGLVWYKKTWGAGNFVLEGRLQDIFPMSELERRAAEVFQ